MLLHEPVSEIHVLKSCDRVVYLAGKFGDDRIHSYIEKLNKLSGVRVKYDWTLERNKSQREAALFDIEGVVRCDIFVAVMDDPSYDYRGTFTELGGALVLSKPIIVVGGDCDDKQYAKTNCFFHHPSIIRVKSFDIVIKLLSKPRRFLVIGAGKHGKDTLAEELSQNLRLSFASSSLAANKFAVYPTLSEKYDYKSEEECFEDRRNHREEWYNLICSYNKEDKSRLAKEIMSSNNIYVGMRDLEECRCSRPLFDLVLWVDASERITEKDPSLHIPCEEADVIIDNNDTLEEFTKRVDKLLYLVK